MKRTGDRTGALAVLCILLCASAATADLSYSYIEIIGSPYVESPVKLGVKGYRATLKGIGVEGFISHALNPNWSLRAAFGGSEANTVEFCVIPDPADGDGVLGVAEADLDRKGFSLMPHFNYRVAENTDIFLGLGLSWEDVNFKLGVIELAKLENSLGRSLSGDE